MTTKKALIGTAITLATVGALLLSGCATSDTDAMSHDMDWAPAGGHGGHGHHTAIPGASGAYAAIPSTGGQAAE